MANKYCSNFYPFSKIRTKFERIQNLINNLMATDFSQKKILTFD